MLNLANPISVKEGAQLLSSITTAQAVLLDVDTLNQVVTIRITYGADIQASILSANLQAGTWSVSGTSATGSSGAYPVAPLATLLAAMKAFWNACEQAAIDTGVLVATQQAN